MPAKNCPTVDEEQILAYGLIVTQRALRSRKEAIGRTMPAKDCTTIDGDAGLQVPKAYNRCGSDWDPFAPSPSQVNLASVVGGQRGRRTLGEFEFIDTNDDVETDDESGSEGDEYPFNWFDLVAGEGSPPWLQAMLPSEE